MKSGLFSALLSLICSWLWSMPLSGSKSPPRRRPQSGTVCWKGLPPDAGKPSGQYATEELQTCGISMRKALYSKEITGSVAGWRFELAHLHTLSDNEVCARLSQIKGNGVWTAEMLMTFSLQRMDIMSWDDLAIQRGLRMLYHHVNYPSTFCQV